MGATIDLEFPGHLVYGGKPLKVQINLATGSVAISGASEIEARLTLHRGTAASAEVTGRLYQSHSRESVSAQIESGANHSASRISASLAPPLGPSLAMRLETVVSGPDTNTLVVSNVEIGTPAA